jgi:hypothetical protein
VGDRRADVDVQRQAHRLAAVERLDLGESLAWSSIACARASISPSRPAAGIVAHGPSLSAARAAATARRTSQRRPGNLGDLAPARGVERGERAPLGGLRALGADQQALGL